MLLVPYYPVEASLPCSLPSKALAYDISSMLPIKDVGLRVKYYLCTHS